MPAAERKFQDKPRADRVKAANTSSFAKKPQQRGKFAGAGKFSGERKGR